MDPITISTAATALRATLPEIARVMSTWLSGSADQSVRLKVVGEHGIEVADLTPANTEALLKKMEAQSEGFRITGGTFETVGGDIIAGHKVVMGVPPPAPETAPVTSDLIRSL